MGSDGLDKFLDDLSKFIPNERLGRGGYLSVNHIKNTSMAIYSEHHKLIANRVQRRFGSYAMFIYGLDEKLGSLADNQEVNLLKMASEDRIPKFHAPLDDWKRYIHTLTKEEQIRKDEYRIDELISQYRKRRTQLWI